MDNSTGNGVAKLHNLHLQLREVQDQLEKGPRQLRARQQIIQQKQDELEAQKQKQKTLKMGADQKSLQLKSNEAKIQDLRTKLNQANSNREFDIIRGQIEADTVANSVLEDEILDALEKVDAGQIALRKLEDELATAKSEEARVAAEIAAAEPGFKARIAELQTAITAAESCLPGEFVTPYRRLVQAYGAAALAKVEGTICGVCFVNLTPQTQVALRAGQVMFCKTCGRLMYLPGDA
jgi:uncharacterized protein